jgi:hypothetical protein
MRRPPLYSVWNAPSDLDYYLGVGALEDDREDEPPREDDDPADCDQVPAPGNSKEE